jgi:hypothetical protein
MVVLFFNENVAMTSGHVVLTESFTVEISLLKIASDYM